MKFGIQARAYGNKRTIDEAAEGLKAVGYDGLEWGWDVGGSMSPAPDDRESLLAAARRIEEISRANGLEPFAVTPSFALRDTEKNPDLVRLHFEAAAEAEVQFLRLFPTCYILLRRKEGLRYHEQADEFRRQLDVLAACAEATGVKAVFELHDGYLAASFSGIYGFLKDYSPRELGALVDPENMVREGIESWRMGIEMLGDYLGYFHVKNMVYVPTDDPEGGWSPPQHMHRFHTKRVKFDDGIVDWPQILLILKEVGYQGYLCDEDMRHGITMEDRFENLAYLKDLATREGDPWAKWE